MNLVTLLVLAFFNPSLTWLQDFSVAKSEAAKTNKDILLTFSGSDWCGPCIRMHREVYESDSFKSFAGDHLVLVNADFPRLKKNQLSKEQIEKNNALAEKYNPEGKFPFTVLTDAQGKILHQWDGLPKETPDQFVEEIAASEHDQH